MACDKIVIRSRAEHSDKLWTPFVYSSRQSCRNKRMCACNQTLGPFTTAPRLLHTVCWHKSCFLQTTFKERKTHIENVPSKHNCNCSLNIGSFQNHFKLSQKNELRFSRFSSITDVENRMRRQGRATSVDSITSQEEAELRGPVRIIPVLRRLGELSDVLGSLGPQVIHNSCTRTTIYLKTS